jgi:hypothetical protein
MFTDYDGAGGGGDVVYSNPLVYAVLLTQDTHSTLVFQF